MSTTSRRGLLQTAALWAAGWGVFRTFGQDAPASQPSSRPGAGPQRRPDEAEILRNLLRQQEQAIRPVQPGRTSADTRPAEAPGLLLEGTFLLERPAKLLREGEQSRLLLQVGPQDPEPRAFAALPNQLLELLEREAEAGFTEFIVSAEVTRYRGENYLLLRKVLRRVSNGNLSP